MLEKDFFKCKKIQKNARKCKKRTLFLNLFKGDDIQIIMPSAKRRQMTNCLLGKKVKLMM